MLEYSTTDRTLWLYGEVAATGRTDDGFSELEFTKALNKIGPGPLTLHCNSPGGAVDRALAVYNQLERWPGPITCINDSVVASAMSFIFCVGDVRLVSPHSHLMIHSPHVYASGSANDLRLTANILDKYSETMLSIYKKRTWATEATLREMLAKETWFDGNEAVDFGFATGTVGKPTAQVTRKVAASRLKGPTQTQLAASATRKASLSAARTMARHDRRMAELKRTDPKRWLKIKERSRQIAAERKQGLAGQIAKHRRRMKQIKTGV